ncbi:hypothetical protein GCM10027074_56930 [Streptomyces deserti]
MTADRGVAGAHGQGGRRALCRECASLGVRPGIELLLNQVSQVMFGCAFPGARWPSETSAHLEEIFSGDGTRPMRLPVAAIVALLGEFDVAVGAARTTISRLARRGAPEGSRQGGTARTD